VIAADAEDGNAIGVCAERACSDGLHTPRSCKLRARVAPQGAAHSLRVIREEG
jgi:hypothetical protein